MDPIELTISDGDETFVLIATAEPDGSSFGFIDEVISDQRVAAFARTQYNPETRYATAGDCLLALMRALFPALGIRE